MQYVVEKEEEMKLLTRDVDRLRNELDEEKKKTEDFLFQVEEGEILKDDLEVGNCC